MKAVREPAVAGSFYPAHRERLRAAVTDYLAQVSGEGTAPKAIIAPHAGYVYSGPVAASAYAPFKTSASGIDRVVLLGPAHRVPVRGLAATGADGFRTPLGAVPVDTESVAALLALPQVTILDEAHAGEHSLEVQLPFLQLLLEDFRIVPLVVGRASSREVAEVLEHLWGGHETLIVVSSDLSHYLDYDYARERDGATARLIERLEPVGVDDACGQAAINGLLETARKSSLDCRVLDLRNSGDTAGGFDRVVGYGAFLFA